MKALFITWWLPLNAVEVSTGLSVRQRLFVDALAASCDQVEVLYLGHHNPEFRPHENSVESMLAIVQKTWGPQFTLRVCRRQAPPKMNRIVAYWRAAFSFYQQPGYRSASGQPQLDTLIDALAAKPDLIFVHRLDSMPPLLRSCVPLPPVFFDLDDIEHIRLRRSSLSRPWRWRSLAALVHIPMLMKAECDAINLSKAAFVCSKLDVGKLKGLFKSRNVWAVPNSTRIPPAISRSTAPMLLMLGNYGYAPNRFGIEFFVENILPLVRSEMPNAVVLVAGTHTSVLKFASSPPVGVCILGFVDSLDDLYPQAAAVICPIYSGSGTRVKIIEAAAYGMPVVATTIGAEGIDLKDGEEILLADSPAAFAKACVQVLTDSDLASRIGAAARRAAIARYDRNAIVKQLASQFREAV